MTEKIFEQILGIKEIRIGHAAMPEKRIEIYCSSVPEESLCPGCLKKRREVNQTYKRKIRDLSVTGKEVYLYLTTRQFYCPDCNRHFTEYSGFVDPDRTMTERYEQYVYNLCKNSTIQKVSARENIVRNSLEDIYRCYAEKELDGQNCNKTVRVIGMDESAVKKGHKDFATVIVDLEKIGIIDVLDYREKDRLINYFEGKGAERCSRIEVFCSDMWDGFINTARAVFPNASITADRFDFFGHLNKAADNQRKHLRKVFKENSSILNGHYLKTAKTSLQKKRRNQLVHLLSPLN